jgi:hypothetical protein
MIWSLGNTSEKFIGFTKMNQNGNVFGYLQITFVNNAGVQQLSINKCAYNKNQSKIK